MKTMHRYGAGPLALALSIGATDALAARPTFNQTFDIEPVACDGLELDGVTYSSSSTDGLDEDCGAGVGTPTTDSIRSPGIQSGGNIVLRLSFDVPTTTFGFGVAQLDQASNRQSVVVELRRPGKRPRREEILLDTDADPLFSGARYDYRGPAIGSVTLRMGDAYSFPRVAFDNFTYDRKGRGGGGNVRAECPLATVIGRYEWPDVPNVEDSASFCGAEANDDDASFGVERVGGGLSYLAFESLDDARWMVSAYIPDAEAAVCAVQVNCGAYAAAP